MTAAEMNRQLVSDLTAALRVWGRTLADIAGGSAGPCLVFESATPSQATPSGGGAAQQRPEISALVVTEHFPELRIGSSVTLDGESYTVAERIVQSTGLTMLTLRK